jgi:fucose 4-O-acetylase-like acetyltransferase
VVVRVGDTATDSRRDPAIDYLRGCIIVLVVFVHAALAYTTFSRVDPVEFCRSTAPIVDKVRWPVLDLPVLFCDVFFMPLLFLVSGLFAAPSLDRRGAGGFAVARLARLGVPFAFGAAVLAPLTYYASYRASTAGTAGDFLGHFFTSDTWQVGPPWFLWVLLAFSLLLATVSRTGGLPRFLRRSPRPVTVALAMVASCVLVAVVVDPGWWISIVRSTSSCREFLSTWLPMLPG